MRSFLLANKRVYLADKEVPHAGEQVPHADKQAPLAKGRLVPAYPYFINHPHRRTVERVGYWPHVPPQPGTLNLYQGFGVAPRKGNAAGCSDMSAMCGALATKSVPARPALASPFGAEGRRDAAHRARREVCPEGTGKSIVLTWIKRMFGRHALILDTPEQLVGRFNAHLEAVSFVGLNEPSFAGNHEQARKLKAMVADSTITIERKFAAVTAIPNALHIIITSNEDWTVAAGHGARRYCVMEVSPHRAGDHQYFQELADEADTAVSKRSSTPYSTSTFRNSTLCATCQKQPHCATSSSVVSNLTCNGRSTSRKGCCQPTPSAWSPVARTALHATYIPRIWRMRGAQREAVGRHNVRAMALVARAEPRPRWPTERQRLANPRRDHTRGHRRKSCWDTPMKMLGGQHFGGIGGMSVGCARLSHRRKRLAFPILFLFSVGSVGYFIKREKEEVESCSGEAPQKRDYRNHPPDPTDPTEVLRDTTLFILTPLQRCAQGGMT